METVWALKERGAQLAVVSGTLDIVIDTLFPDHPFDDVFTNRLHFDDAGVLVGWQATQYDIHGKPDAVRSLAGRHGIALERCAFVGDGENDVPLLGVVGCLVAFNPRSPELEAGADFVLKGQTMKRILEIL
jgi:HAD superfamily phosphoserine phosphatase-like hydrolase